MTSSTFIAGFLLAIALAPAAPPKPAADAGTPPSTDSSAATARSNDPPRPSGGAGDAPASGGSSPPGSGADDPKGAEPSGDVTRYQFTGLDIDGELRTPALLQFLARIGGEFETLGIPHRSFMPELQATTAEDAL